MFELYIFFNVQWSLFVSRSEFLAQGARDPINVDSRVADTVKQNKQNSPDRYCFDEAEVSANRERESTPFSRSLRSLNTAFISAKFDYSLKLIL